MKRVIKRWKFTVTYLGAMMVAITVLRVAQTLGQTR